MAETIPINAADDDQKVLAVVLDHYHRRLKATEEALGYLRQRGVTNSQVIDHFKVGYADRTLGPMIPSKQVKAGRELRERLLALGLYRGSGHEHFNGCVVFPITAPDGTRRILDVYGRKTLGETLRKGTAIHLNLNDKREGVWNVEAFGAARGEVVLVPSLWDSLVLWNWGYRNVTCMFGPTALTDDHLAAFREFGIKRVLTTSPVVTDKLTESGLETFLVKLPVGEDVNAYARRSKNPADALGTLLRTAEWVGNGKPAGPVQVPVISPEPSPVSTTDPHDEFEDFEDDENGEDEDEDGDVLDDPDDPPKESENGSPTEPEVALEPAAPPPAARAAGADPPIRTASPVPPTPPADDAEVGDDEVNLAFGNRRYRVRGFSKNLSFDVLRVNVLVTNDTGLFIDTFDLYSAKHRRSFVTQAAAELAVEENTIKKDVGRVLLKLEEVQDRQIEAALAPKDARPVMTPEEKDEALRLLKNPKLLDRIVADFEVVGETTNKIVAYLAAVSRKLDRPLAVVIQSSSAAGKTALMEAVLAFVPPEDQVKYSAVTGQSLFYMGEADLKHKVLAIVEEEGAQKASYALKLLQSEGELRIASTGKEVKTNRLVTQEYRVEGPVMLFLTTTSIQVDEELLNRCVVLTVDEDREQTRMIHRLQRRRETLAGLLAARDRQHALTVHRNAQRLLKPLLVANPYAESLTFSDDKTRTRRDHLKYLALIRVIALLHQHQRPVRTTEHNGEPVEYVEVTRDDIRTANRLATEVLGRTLDDLPPQTRRLLDLIDTMVTNGCRKEDTDRADFRFGRRAVREFTGWGHTQLKVHLKRLEDLEYLLVHRGGRGQSFVYELLYQPPAEGEHKFLAGLLDPDALPAPNQPGSGSSRSATGRGKVGPKSAPGRPADPDETAVENSPSADPPAEPDRNAHPAVEPATAS